MPDYRTSDHRLSTLWRAPDAYLLDAGSGAELLISKIRLSLTAGLVAIPAGNMIIGLPEEQTSHETGLLIATMAFLVAVVAYFVVRRELRKPWLPLFTTLMDVTLVSTALLSLGMIGDPHQSVNSKVIFEVYFLAIGVSCLRYDVRLAFLGGAAAILEYLAVVLWAVLGHNLDAVGLVPPPYGRFYWTDQISRMVLLGLATALAVTIVQQLQRHRRLSAADRLTGLFNRAYCDEYLLAELRRARRYGRVFAIAILDIDLFKRFNDTWGHVAGDAALRAVAGVVHRSVRRSDLVARYGGEEFVIVMPESSLGAARARVETIREAVAGEPIRIPRLEERVRITVSGGVAAWPDDAEDLDDLLHIADLRLLTAKAEGRNRVVSEGRPAAPVEA